MKDKEKELCHCCDGDECEETGCSCECCDCTDCECDCENCNCDETCDCGCQDGHSGKCEK